MFVPPTATDAIHQEATIAGAQNILQEAILTLLTAASKVTIQIRKKIAQDSVETRAFLFLSGSKKVVMLMKSLDLTVQRIKSPSLTGE